MHRFLAWSDERRARARAESLDDSGAEALVLDVLLADGRARIRPRDPLSRDPGLLDAACRRIAAEGVHQVVLDVEDDLWVDEEVTGLGFRRGERHVLLERDLPLLPVDPGRRPEWPLVESVPLPEVRDLAVATLPGNADGRPSGAEILLALDGAEGVRCWAAGRPPVAAYVTQQHGGSSHVAIAAHGPQSPVGLVSELVRAAETAAVAAGATTLTAAVAEANTRSRRLCERFGLRVVGTRHWWCRDL